MKISTQLDGMPDVFCHVKDIVLEHCNVLDLKCACTHLYIIHICNFTISSFGRWRRMKTDAILDTSENDESISTSEFKLTPQLAEVRQAHK